MDAEKLQALREKFGSIENYDVFENFITGPNISPSEQQSLLSFIEGQARLARSSFRRDGFPVNRETFALFAEKFDIPTTQDGPDIGIGEISESEEIRWENFEKTKQNYLNSLSTLSKIEGVPETDRLRLMIGGLNSLSGDELGHEIKKIEAHLV